jgi:two-component system, LytTR family, response regulator AlgR
MHVLIVDDEQLARLRLRTLLDELAGPLAPLTWADAPDAEAALAALRERPADVVLLDIHMPGRDGLKLATALKSLPQPPAVVFVTAHAEHALQAFELQALDYLTKPVRRERLLAALQRVPPPAAVPPVPEPVLVVSDRGRVLRLPVREVVLLKAEQKYVTLRTASHTHVLDDSLSDLEQRLGAAFVRVHRNSLVSVSAIRALAQRAGGGDDGEGNEGWAVHLPVIGEWVAVSRRQLAAVRAAIAVAG